MNILITGAGGFVGGHLIAHLRQARPDAALHGTLWNAETPRPELKDCAWWPLDTRDPEAVTELMAHVRPAWVFHLAGQAFVPRAYENPWETLEINMRGALNFFEAMRRLALDSRILVIGSADEYGIVRPDQLPLRESEPLNPANPYGVSKVAQDFLAGQFARAFNLGIVRVRSFNHIGPGQSARFAASDWAAQIAAAEVGQREPVVYVGDLSAQRDFTDVRDVVRAYTLALEKGVPGAVYNVCSGKAFTMEYILKTLVAMSTVPIEIRIDKSRLRVAEIPILYGDSTALREATGWSPAYPIEESLRAVMADWRAHYQKNQGEQ